MVALIALLASQQVDGRMMPSGQLLAPAGQVLELDGGRPVDLAVSGDGKTLFVKDRDKLRVIDAASFRETGFVASPGGASIWGIDVDAGGKVYFTNSENSLHVFGSSASGYKLERSIQLPGPDGKGHSYPCGVRVRAEVAYVCLSRNNALAIVDLASGRIVRQIPTGIAPYDVELVGDRAWVSNQGGRLPGAGDKTAPSAGTETPTDDRGVAKTGTVSLIDLGSGANVRDFEVGLQPSDIQVLGDGIAVVANANSDTISFVDSTKNSVRNLVVKPDPRLPFGSMPNALALSSDKKRLYVALGGNNALAVIADPLGRPSTVGFMPTGWYPAAVQSVGGGLFVANNKGVGSRTLDPKQQGRNSHQHRGTLQKMAVPGEDALLAGSRKVKELAFVPQILRAYDRVASSAAKPIAIPKKLGEPSTIEHVVYVIKENRTYDQMFGDMAQGDGDPKLCTFPEVNSPNHHALARQFVLLDNYYCNGVLSADGHSWATEGNVTPYLERAFGGFNRSYTFGDDPITYSSSGFIWDHVLAGGLSFRNYGEMNYSEPARKMTHNQMLAARTRNEQMEFTHNIGIERLRRYSHLRSPGWNMDIPDQIRVDRFLEEFRQFEKDGKFPNLTIVYLPQDHLGGPVSSRAHMADNDLAVGRLVEAISKSRYWPRTAIFINEDDPQNGFDHVDGHRSTCLVVSPWTKRKAVVSNFYNQTSVLRTMLHIFGLPPMNQKDASSPLMSACFTDKPDFSTYTALPANFSLDDSDLKKDQSTLALSWAKVKASVPIKRTGMKTAKDEDNLNRFIWHEMKGWNTPYPAHLAGPHGKGLTKRKLILVPDKE